MIARQPECAAGLVLRPAVRCGGRGARHLPASARPMRARRRCGSKHRRRGAALDDADGLSVRDRARWRSSHDRTGPMWRALLRDLAEDTPPPVIAARFHKGLAAAITAMAGTPCRARPRFRHRGAVGRLLSEPNCCSSRRSAACRRCGFTVLTHAQVPTNDGGLALGQAAIAAARLIGKNRTMCLGIPGQIVRLDDADNDARHRRCLRRAPADQYQPASSTTPIRSRPASAIGYSCMSVSR